MDSPAGGYQSQMAKATTATAATRWANSKLPRTPISDQDGQGGGARLNGGSVHSKPPVPYDPPKVEPEPEFTQSKASDAYKTSAAFAPPALNANEEVTHPPRPKHGYSPSYTLFVTCD